MPEDVGEEPLGGIVALADHVDLVVVGGRGEIDVARGEVELGAVLVERLVAEHAEGHVAVTELGGVASHLGAEEASFLKDTLALGDGGADVFAGLV